MAGGVLGDRAFGYSFLWFGVALYCAFIRGQREGNVVAFPLMRLLLFAVGILCVGLTGQTEDNRFRIGLIVAAVGMVAYAMIRDAGSSNRMFPKNTLIPSTTVGASYWFLLLFTFTFIVAVLYATLYLQVLHNQTPIAAAYISAVMSFTWTITALLTASWTGRSIRVAVLSGGVLILMGAIGLGLFAVNGPLILIILSLALMGGGIGASNNHVIALTIECAADGEQGLVASSVQTMRTMGLAFGSAMAGLIASIAGLTEGAGPEIVAEATNMLNHAGIVLATLTFFSLVIFYHHYDRDKKVD